MRTAEEVDVRHDLFTLDRTAHASALTLSMLVPSHLAP